MVYHLPLPHMELENVWVEVNVAAHTDTNAHVHSPTRRLLPLEADKSNEPVPRMQKQVMMGWVCTGLWTHYPPPQLPVPRLAGEMMGPGCMWPTALPFVCALTLSGQTEGYVPSDSRLLRESGFSLHREPPAAGPLPLPAVSVSLGGEWVVKRTLQPVL